MKETWTNFLQMLGFAWWVEIVTENPHCTYYFGPFASEGEASLSQAGYLEDLTQEGALNIKAVVKQCRPKQLTIYDEKEPVMSRAAVFG
jgi:hypothetical protein